MTLGNKNTPTVQSPLESTTLVESVSSDSAMKLPKSSSMNAKMNAPTGPVPVTVVGKLVTVEPSAGMVTTGAAGPVVSSVKDNAPLAGPVFPILLVISAVIDLEPSVPS